MSAQNNIGFQGFPVPIGSILYYCGGPVANDFLEQSGWIIPSGQTLLKADYPELWALLRQFPTQLPSTATTFQAPNLTTQRPTTLGFNLLLGTNLEAGGTIPTDVGADPDSAYATLVEQNLPQFDLDYQANSLQYQATFINNVAGQSGTLYSASATGDRTGGSGEGYQLYSRTDVDFRNTNIVNQYSNLNQHVVKYVNNAQTPIDGTGTINIDPAPVPPYIGLVPILKARYT